MELELAGFVEHQLPNPIAERDKKRWLFVEPRDRCAAQRQRPRGYEFSVPIRARRHQSFLSWVGLVSNPTAKQEGLRRPQEDARSRRSVGDDLCQAETGLANVRALLQPGRVRRSLLCGQA